MARTVNETTAFRIRAFERPRWMVWGKPHSTWAWKLTHSATVARLPLHDAWRLGWDMIRIQQRGRPVQKIASEGRT